MPFSKSGSLLRGARAYCRGGGQSGRPGKTVSALGHIGLYADANQIPGDGWPDDKPEPE
jgi:hypothetical protein